jgi:hypothetical protein
LTCLTVFFLSSAIAYANVYPAKWSSSKVSYGKLGLTYNYDYVNSGSISSSEVINGINSWLNIGANFFTAEAAYWNADVVYREVSYSQWSNNGWSQSTQAWTQPIAGSKACSNGGVLTYNCTSSDTITAAAVYINTAQLPLTSSNRQAIIAHELGHAIGVDHHTLMGQNSIMWQDVWKNTWFSYTPTSADVADVNSLYHP